MNLNRLIKMLTALFLGRLVRAGVRKATRPAARGNKPAGPKTAAERQQTAQARELQKRARQAAKITRRLGR